MYVLICDCTSKVLQILPWPFFLSVIVILNSEGVLKLFEYTVCIRIHETLADNEICIRASSMLYYMYSLNPSKMEIIGADQHFLEKSLYDTKFGNETRTFFSSMNFHDLES